MKVKIGQEVYVDKINATCDIMREIPGGLGRVVDIRLKIGVSGKPVQLIAIEEVFGAEYTWTNHLEKHQATLKKIYGKTRAGEL